jgi:dihydrodipicolinate synthase/N-acetylneuraminate lyase
MPTSKTATPLTGVLVALVTPFTPDGSAIDEQRLREHVEWMISSGIHGIVPAGTTGEFTTLTRAEREFLVETVIDAANGRVPVVPATGALSTVETIELSRHAQDAGAAAVMVVPPFYDPLRWNELLAHCTAVTEALDIPVMYYNVPGATGTQLSPEQLAALGDIPGLDYVKDTGGDAVALTELLLRYADRVTVFNGWDTLTFLGMALGAKGSVWGAANVIPELSVALWEALAVRGDLAEGRRLWEAIWPVCDALEATNYVAAVKGGLDIIGRSAGPVRSPILPINDAENARLAAAINSARAALP